MTDIILCKCPRCGVIGPKAGTTEVTLRFQTLGENTYHYEFEEWFKEKDQRTRICPLCMAELVAALSAWCGISPAELPDPASGTAAWAGELAPKPVHWWPWAVRVMSAFPRHLKAALGRGVGS